MALAYIPAGRVPAVDQTKILNEDTIYWKRLEQLAVFQEPGPVTSVDFSPRKPHIVASTSSVRLSLYDPVICEPINLFSRFKQAVFGVKFRKDGQLIAIGGEEGKLRVFDVDRTTGTGKAPLRSVRVGQTTCRVAEFNASGRSIFSMSDDGFVKQFDLGQTGSQSVIEFQAHNDSIRTGVASATNDSLVFTGGYDHKIKLWDIRSSTSECVFEMDAGHPVEKIILLPSENLLASAAGPIVKIWDLSAGGRQIVSIQQHHKTVTSLALGSFGSCLLTGGIDRRINVFRISDFSLCHSMSMAAQVFGVAMSPDDQTMAVGMGNLLALHKRAPVKKVVTAYNVADGKSVIRTAAPKVLIQEKGGAKTSTELQARSQNSLKLDRIDVNMKQYKHAQAIRVMFSRWHYHQSRQEQVIGWLRQLLHRRVLRAAISGQSGDVIKNLVRFIITYLMKNNYFLILKSVSEAVFDVYGNEEIDPKIARMMIKLKGVMAREIKVQQELCLTIGALDLLICSSKLDTYNSDEDDDIFGEPEFCEVGKSE